MKDASSSATVFSIVETAKANNLRPYEYIKFLLENISKIDFENNPDEIDNPLPWSPNIPEYCISIEKNSIKLNSFR
jgi:transposase